MLQLGYSIKGNKTKLNKIIGFRFAVWIILCKLAANNNTMRTLILAFMLLASFKSNAQFVPAEINNKLNANYELPFFKSKDIRVISKYDTTVLYNGLITFKHTHDFVQKDNRNGYNGMGIYVSCAVNHGPEGCSANWEDYNIICTTCLIHLNVKESRSTEKVLSKYDEALERLNKLKKQ